MKTKIRFWMPAILFALSSVFLTNCEDPTIPVVSTNEATAVTNTTATSGGVISSDGGATVTARGVCWSTSETPTIADNKTSDGTGAGSFTSAITGLTANTTYYVRAYATNSAGTGYGSAVSFIAQQGGSATSFTDIRDGNVYKTVKIGNQVWMAENLAYEPSSGNYWAYDNNNSNVETYGYLYDWETACDVCPAGWHLPSDAEWTELTDYLGGTTGAGGKLKETGTTHWASPNTGATNETGFTALPGGYRYGDGAFDGIGSSGYWWSATEHNSNNAWNRVMYCYNSNVYRFSLNKELWFSVRCLRD